MTERYTDDYEPTRAPGSRVSVLLVGLLIGAVVMTAVWVGIAGNPLSDDNEVAYHEITITDVDTDRDTVCWSEDPARRDAGQLCAILALDPATEVPVEGDEVVLGVVMLQAPGQEPTRQAVYAAPLRRGGDSTEPSASESN